jgi:hypothetical protein
MRLAVPSDSIIKQPILVIASEAKQSIDPLVALWIASSLPPSLFELRRTSRSSQ